jgi:ubiquinone/menaquinone biosynthesis C-methylase UbiE
MTGSGTLSDRQIREANYHRTRAVQLAYYADRPVNMAPVMSGHHRWWNAYWVVLRKAKSLELRGKSALVIGCGFGDDAVHLAALGASVSAVDISPESVEIAQRRAAASGADIRFEVTPAETLPFGSASFDLIYLPDVLHHLDIHRALNEIKRVLKPEGLLLGNEPYTHSWLQRVRNSWFVNTILYPRLVKRLYGTDTPYITEDERKLNEKDLLLIDQTIPITSRQYFLLISGRLVRIGTVVPLVEQIFLNLLPIGRWLAGRVVFTAMRVAPETGHRS